MGKDEHGNSFITIGGQKIPMALVGLVIVGLALTGTLPEAVKIGASTLGISTAGKVYTNEQLNELIKRRERDTHIDESLKEHTEQITILHGAVLDNGKAIAENKRIYEGQSKKIDEIAETLREVAASGG